MAVRRSAGAFGIRVVGAGTALLLQLLLARTMPHETFGQYVYALSWMNILVLVGMLGLDTSSLRFVASYCGTGAWGLLHAYLRKSIRWSLTASLTCGGLLAAVGAVVRASGHADLGASFVAAGGLLPVLAVLQVVASWLQALKRPVLSQAVSGVLRPILFAALVVGASLCFGWKPSAAGALWLHFVAACVSLAVAWGVWQRQVPAPARSTAPEVVTPRWLRTSVPLLVIAGAQVMLGQADLLMLGLFHGTRHTGAYAIASQLADLIIFGITAANLVIAPLIADLHAQGKRAELQKVLTTVSRALLLYSLPVAVVLVVGGYRVLGIYGRAYQEAWLPMSILVIGELMIALAGSVGFLLTMTGNESIALRIVLLSLAANVVLNAALIPSFGMVGAAAATVCATALRTVLLSISVRRRLHLNPTAFTWG